MSFEAYLEQLLYKRAFITKTLNIERYEEAVAKVLQAPIDDLASTIRNSIIDDKAFIALAVSEAILRRPLLGYRLQFMFKRSGEDIEVFDTDSAIFRCVENLSDINEDVLEHSIECSRLSRSSIKDARRCREEFVSSLIKVSKESSELISAIFSLGAVPSNIEVGAAPLKNILKYAIMWPHLAVYLKNGKHAIAWYELERLVKSTSRSHEKEVDYIAAASSGDTALFVLSTPSGTEHGEEAYFITKDGKVEYISGLKICYGNEGYVYVLRSSSESRSITAYDSRGIIYTKTVETPLQKIELVSCTPLLTSGVVFKVERPEGSVLIVAKRKIILEYPLNYRLEHLVAAPLDILLGFADDRIAVFWVTPRNLVAKEVKIQTPRIARVEAVPHFGLLLVADGGIYRTNYVLTVRNDITDLLTKAPSSITTLWFSTFSLVAARDSRGVVRRLILASEGGLNPVEIGSIETLPVADIVHSGNTVCLVAGSGSLRCFSPVYLKSVALARKPISRSVVSTGTLLKAYRESGELAELLRILNDAYGLSNIKVRDSFLFREGELLSSIESAIRKFSYSIDKLLVKSIKRDIALDWLKLVLDEYFSKDVERVAVPLLKILAEKYGTAELYVNREILAVLGQAYRVLSSADEVAKLESRQLLRSLGKVFGCVEIIDTAGVAGLDAVQYVLPDDVLKAIVSRLVNYAEKSGGQERSVVLSYLANLGVRLEDVISEISGISEALTKLGLKQLASLFNEKVREALRSGDLRKLRSTVDSIKEVSSSVSMFIGSLPRALHAAYLDEIARVLQDCLTAELSIGNYLNTISSIGDCYRELANVYNRVNSLASAIERPVDSITREALSESRSCRDRVRRLSYLEKQLSQVLNLKNEAERLSAEVLSLPIRPRVVDILLENIGRHISNLDAVSLGKELVSLRSCLEVARYFNIGINKLAHLAKTLSSSEVAKYVDLVIQEFRSLDRVDESVLRKSQDLVKLDIHSVLSYLDRIESRLKCLLDVDVARLKNGVSEGFVQKVAVDGYDRAIAYLQRIDMLLEQLCLEVKKYGDSVEHLLYRLRIIGISDNLLRELSKHERAILAQHLVVDSIDSLQSRFDDYRSAVAARKSLVDDLRLSAERLHRPYQELEEETKKAILRSLLSEFESIVKSYGAPSLGSLRDLLERYARIISDSDFVELSKRISELSAQKQTLTSATARSLLDAVLSICGEKLVKKEYREVREILAFAYRELVGTMKYENIDKLMSILETSGLNIVKHVGINSSTFQQDILNFVSKLRRLNEVSDFVSACPAAIAKIIDASKDIDSALVASFKLFKEIGGSVRDICSLLEATTFSGIDEIIVEGLAAVGRDLIGYSARSKSEKTLLAHLTFLKHFGELAVNKVSCQDAQQKLAKTSSEIFSSIYTEFCVRRDIGRSLMYASLACATRHFERIECRESIELLGGFYVNKYVKLVNDLTSILGVKVDDVSVYKYILDRIASSTSADSEEVRDLADVLDEIVSRFENLVSNVSDLHSKVNLSTVIRSKDKVDLSEVAQILSFYVDLLRRNAQLDRESVDVRVFGELVDSDESSLVLEVCNRLPIPLDVQSPLIDFVDMNFKVFMDSIEIEPRTCRRVSISIKRMYDVDKLHLGREARALVEFKCVVPGTSISLNYSIPAYVPVKHYGQRSELVEVINDIASKPEFKKKVTIDIERLREIVRGVGGNSVVVLGRYVDGSEVVVKIPVFYRNIPSITMSRDLIEHCQQVAERCVKATQKCSQTHPSIVEVLDINIFPPYAIERFASGKLLRDLISKKGRLGLDEALSVAIPVSEGVLCVHSQDVYHNDIRPENVIVELDSRDRVSRVFLIDVCIDSVWNSLRGGLGSRGLRVSELRKKIDERYLHPNLGRMLEIAPEDRVAEVRKAIDVFQVGVLIYEMLTGINPVAELKDLEQTRRALLYIPVPLPSILRDALEKVLLPSDKFAVDLRSFIEVLKKVRGG